MKPMQFDSAEIEALPDLAADEQVALEQKCDGVRVLAEVTPGKIAFFGAGGDPIRFAAAAQWLPALTDALGWPDPDFAITLDGELMIENGTYIVFDMPYLRFGDKVVISPESELIDRRRALESIQSGFTHRLRLVMQARTPEEKVALVRRVVQLGGEGFMAKRLDSPYNPGRRVSHSVKVKFVHTADCFVTSWERGAGTGSARLAVYDEGFNEFPVGGCSLIGKPEVRVGTVVEVAYAHFRGAMIQPRMLRVREDKDPRECTLAQFPAYSKEVV